MDWPLTGALVGVALLAGTVGYELLAIAGSSPEPAKQFHATSILLPARDRPAVDASAYAPAAQYPAPVPASAPLAYSTASASAPASGPRLSGSAAAPQPTNEPRVYSTASASERPYHLESPAAAGNRPKDHAPPAEYASAAHNETKPPPKMTVDAWEVQITAKASYFNLGGHVDKNGIVDSTASSYLRDALKKNQNYPKLPAEIKAYIEAPNINLTKIAGYRVLLGMDDREMEEKQGVKFIRVASSRGLDITGPDAAELEASPFDLSPLERMDFDLRLGMVAVP
jgi:hypothetical protein